MCGIFGIVSSENVLKKILKGLTRLEYRGYDSSGIAINTDKKIITERSEGKLGNLKSILKKKKIKGNIGIGHTRWATHGIPSKKNAHPHSTDSVSIVHNGIIENYQHLKKNLLKKGCIFNSQTDSEVIAHELSIHLEDGCSPSEAIKRTLPKLDGAFALAILFRDYDTLIGARRGSPLALGISENELYLGSDSIAISPFTQRISFLEEGDWVEIKKESYQIYNSKNKLVKRNITLTSFKGEDSGKGNFNHFMQKEIFEQPSVLGDSLSRFIDPIKKKIQIENLKIDWRKVNNIKLIACGSSYYACLTATYWMQKYAKIPADAELASEFRYKSQIAQPRQLCIFISQSGETADTLAALKYAKKHKMRTLSIVNVPESSIFRESDFNLFTAVGPEIGVASTKALTAQLAVLACLTISIASKKSTISPIMEKKLTSGLIEIPSKITEILQIEKSIKNISKEISKAKSCLFLGREACFPIAMEGALKLKEISYIHAEGYASGEMKHGPIALVDEEMPVIAICPDNFIFEKNISNIQEILARGGKVFVVTDKLGEKKMKGLKISRIIIPECVEMFIPILYCVPVQLIAYYTALIRGTDIDQPRNLAKSVTVE